ncbi:MAG TPA: fucose isomerase [Terracidiphilus sp.]
MDVFSDLDLDAPLVVAEAVWQYSHHLLPGLQQHRGPILTVANWSGQWPGLVGLLNLNGCLSKSGVQFSSLWSEDFDDDFFLRGIRQWLLEHRISQDSRHVHAVDLERLPKREVDLGLKLARLLKSRKAIIGVFDEGCMGMYNAIVEDHLLNPTGVYKERLSQSALVAAMHRVSQDEALEIRNWLDLRGMEFRTGSHEETDLTDAQILEQCKMYIAAVRIADEFSCDAIGIQYQQGLKDLTPASDLVEGLLNNVDRPPVFGEAGTRKERELYQGQALPHFNEVDECAGLDALVTNWVWNSFQIDPATTLHDVRWGEHYVGSGFNDFVWLFQISGACPPSHLIGGYRGAISERQPPMYFRLGGGTLKGICKPGIIVWSRVFVEGGCLHADLGLADVIQLPAGETERRWQSVTRQWPIMHVRLRDITRDQFMARHRANHLNVAYAPDQETSEKALAAKAAMMVKMGIQVHFCGRTPWS